MTHRFTGLVAALVVTLPCFLVSEAAEAQELTLNRCSHGRPPTSSNSTTNSGGGAVMEEIYEQRAWSTGGNGYRGALGASYQRRTLRSDYLLIQPEGADRYF